MCELAAVLAGGDMLMELLGIFSVIAIVVICRSPSPIIRYISPITSRHRHVVNTILQLKIDVLNFYLFGLSLT